MLNPLVHCRSAEAWLAGLAAALSTSIHPHAVSVILAARVFVGCTLHCSPTEVEQEVLMAEPCSPRTPRRRDPSEGHESLRVSRTEDEDSHMAKPELGAVVRAR